jgi:hypothetical protein
MSSIARPQPACVLVRLTRFIRRALVFALRVLIVGFSMGIAPPSLVVKVIRHDDATVQVDEADDENAGARS